MFEMEFPYLNIQDTDILTTAISLQISSEQRFINVAFVASC